MIIWANLDCEARWANQTLPRHVLEKISAAAITLAAFAHGDEDVEVWTPADVDPARIRMANVVQRTGAPPRYDLAWASPEAKAVNDRRLALALHERLGTRLPGSRVVASLDELDEAARALAGRWVAKAPWTAAGRDRAYGEGPLTGEQRVYVERLIARMGGLVFEPWCERMFDLGLCALLGDDGEVVPRPVHTLLSDPRGGFVGIELSPPPLTSDERRALVDTSKEVTEALAGAGYTGPFGIDAFVYREQVAPGDVFVVLAEDTYETRFGDGYYAYFETAFRERAAAEAWIEERARLPRAMNTMPTAYHVRPARLVGAATGELICELRDGERASVDDVLGVLGARKLHAPCEINARYTFGHVAHALGANRLGFGEPPEGARVLVDGSAWIST